MGTCVECGRALDAEAKFCLICGTPVEAEERGSTESPDPFKTVVKGALAYGVVNLEQLPQGHLIDDRYEVMEKLGQGGFGAVYRVFDRKMECEKALKVLPEVVASDRSAMVSLKGEAVTMARLNHPGIVRIYDFCDTGSIKYIDMEYVEGKSLSDALVDEPHGRFDEERVKNLARQLAETLSYAHTQGIIHKDIKPQNILITQEGTPKIADFGISEAVKSSMSRIVNSSSSGTLFYMAPEQIRGKDVGRESDIYSFGALLYELLSGHPPFYKGSIEYQILSESVPPLEGILDSLNRLVLRCLEKDYTDRFRSFDEVLAVLDGKEMSKENMSEVTLDSKGKTPGKPVWLVAAVVILLMAAAGVYGLVGKGDTHSSAGAVEGVAVPAPVIVHEPESSKIPADLPFLAEQEIKIRECRGSIGEFQHSIVAMKARLDSGAVKGGDSLEAMLRLIQQKKAKTIDIERLEEETRHWAHKQLKRDIEIYAGLIAMEEGESLKEMAWQRLVKNHPSEARGVALYDTEALLEGGRLTVSTSPDGSRIKILNIGPAYIPGMKLKPGNYQVQVDHEGYESERTTVAISEGEDERVVILLKSIPTLTVHVTPSDARVKVLNIKSKFIQGMDLKPGEYYLSVSRVGYETKEEWVTLVRGQAFIAEVALVRVKRLSNTLGMAFVYIEPGSFMMGSPLSESGRDDDETQHRVRLSKGYYLQTTEVTQGQWTAVMGSHSSNFSSCGDNCPVEKVSWTDAQTFIQKLNAREGGNRYRLPTEAEWEFGCRAGSETPYTNGKSLSSVGWYDENSGSKTYPVAQKRSNAWGLYDMHGNVWEWCQDWKGDYPSGDVTDPVGPLSGSHRVTRGGSWYGSARGCRGANRGGSRPGDRNGFLGFRLVRRS